MYRKLRRKTGGGPLDLDSLMDILSCLVGVMLFLVIYTVLELGSVAYEAQVPVGRFRPAGAERVMVLCQDGRVRVLDVRQPLTQLLSGFEIVRSFDEVPVFVESNRGEPVDAWFSYELVHRDRLSVDLLGTLELVVTEREGMVGDSIHQLADGSRYQRALERLAPDEAWLSFAVDSASVDVFRRARELAVARGFATGWDRQTIAFPLELPLSPDRRAEWFARGDAVKPQR